MPRRQRSLNGVQVLVRNSRQQMCDAIAARQAAIRASTDPPVRQFGGPPRRCPHRPVGWSGCRLDRERATARQSAGEPKRRRLAVSYARRLGDAVDPAALLCGGSEGEAELLLQSPREDAAHRVALRSAVRSSVSSSAGLRVAVRARKTRRRTPRAKPMIADGGRLGAARRDFVSPFPAPPLDFT